MGEKATVRLELPWPPSVNHYYRHVGPRVLISQQGRKFRERILAIYAMSGMPKLKGDLHITLDLYPPDARRRDNSNILKALEDALQHAGMYDDDYQLAWHSIRRREPMPPDGMIAMEVTEL